MKKTVLLGGILLSAALAWFAVGNYLSARPIAEENLRGLALSLASAIENIAFHDPSLQSLDTFLLHDIVIFALEDRKGVYRFHTNPDLTGKPVQGAMTASALRDGATSDERITLRTGERAFEFNSP